MSQAANILIHKPSTAVFDFIIQKVKAFKEPKQVAKPAINYHDSNIEKLINWLGNISYINGIQYTVIPAGQLYLNDRLVIKFSLTEKFSSNFVLLRGLFEFGKPSGIIISANKSDKTFTIDVLSAQILTSSNYLETIFNWLAKEIKFKATLKEVIQLKEELKVRERIAFSNLRAALA